MKQNYLAWLIILLLSGVNCINENYANTIDEYSSLKSKNVISMKISTNGNELEITNRNVIDDFIRRVNKSKTPFKPVKSRTLKRFEIEIKDSNNTYIYSLRTTGGKPMIMMLRVSNSNYYKCGSVEDFFEEYEYLRYDIQNQG